MNDLSSYLAIHKYTYARQSKWLVRLTYFIGLVAWCGVLYGYSRFFALSPVYWWIFGPMVGLLGIYYFLNYGLNLFYPGFSVEDHETQRDLFWKKTKTLPSIDVFLPICGEDHDIIRRTFLAVQDLEYSKLKVHVLDDYGDPEAKQLAKKLGFNYLSRPNKGEMKKAGNLKYGFEHTKGEFFIVFDADSAPAPDFIKELLPYMQDEHVGIVQSPQFFETTDEVHYRSPIEYGAAVLQQDFYRVIQVSRDRFEGSICVGSNAIYRRAALEKVGGPVQVDHGEDVHTGLAVTSAGYRIKYVPVILAIGLCPTTVLGFFKQHNRWCSSSTGMFLKSKVLRANTTFAQKVCYYTGFLYYLCQGLFFLLPLQLFVLLWRHFEQIDLIKALPFIPFVIFGIFVIPWTRPGKPKYGLYLASIVTIYTHTITVLLRFFGKAATWVPTNTVKTGTNGGATYKTFMALVVFSWLYLFFYITATVVTAANYRLPVLNVMYYSVLFWVFWNIGLHGLFFVNGVDALLSRSWQPVSHRLTQFVYAAFVIVAFTGLTYFAGSKNVESNAIALAERNRLPQTVQVEGMPFSTVAPSATPAVTTATLQAPATQEANQAATYAYTVQRGDSQTKLARRAVAAYEQVAEVSLNPAQKIFMETKLVDELGRSDQLDVGASLDFSLQIEQVAQQSQQLTPAQLQAWQGYANQVDFTQLNL